MQETNGLNEAEIITRIAGGDENAFTVFYAYYYKKLYDVALRYLYLPDMADDLLQDLFTKFWSHREKLTGINNLSAYLFVMFRNQLISELRNKQRQNRIKAAIKFSLQKNVTDPSNENKRELEGSIAAAISTLSERQQLIFKLSREKGLNHTEISDLLNISPRTVSNTISFVLSHLKKSLVKQGLLFFSIFMYLAVRYLID